MRIFIVLWFEEVLLFLYLKDRVDQFTEPYVKKLLNDEFGGWPLSSGSTNSLSPLDLLKRINKYGFLRFANIGISPNPDDPLHYVIKVKNQNICNLIVERGNHRIPFEKITQPDDYSAYFFGLDNFVQAFKGYYKTVAEYLNTARNASQSDIDDILELTKVLAQVKRTSYD